MGLRTHEQSLWINVISDVDNRSVAYAVGNHSSISNGNIWNGLQWVVMLAPLGVVLCLVLRFTACVPRQLNYFLDFRCVNWTINFLHFLGIYSDINCTNFLHNGNCVWCCSVCMGTLQKEIISLR